MSNETFKSVHEILKAQSDNELLNEIFMYFSIYYEKKEEGASDSELESTRETIIRHLIANEYNFKLLILIKKLSFGELNTAEDIRDLIQALRQFSLFFCHLPFNSNIDPMVNGITDPDQLLKMIRGACNDLHLPVWKNDPSFLIILKSLQDRVVRLAMIKGIITES